MAAERVVPEDPLALIQQRVRERKLLWTYHVNMRLQGRSLSRQVILDAVESYEIIESYPQAKYLPSYLVYAQHGDTVMHVLFAVDAPGDNVRVVTAYRPDPAEWESDLKRRKSE